MGKLATGTKKKRDNFSYNLISSGKTVIVEDEKIGRRLGRQQMVVYRTIEINGTLELKGDLAIIGG